MLQNLFTKKQVINHSNKIKKIQDALTEADAVIIGAGAGLSTSAGFIMLVKGSINIFSILKEDIVSMTCIQVVFIPIIH